MHDYVRDGAEIYRRSFATIRTEAELSRFPQDVAQIVVRMIHACGQVDLADDIAFTPNAVNYARSALWAGAPVLCDSEMVAAGITRRRLPAQNEVICTLGDPRVPGLAHQLRNTRSAAALWLWHDRLDGAVVAIGNAPTSLFFLLHMLAAGAPRPAAIVGGPVGFVGAVESKDQLIEYSGSGPIPKVEYLTVRGRRGGSAITAAAVNALASEAEIDEDPVQSAPPAPAVPRYVPSSGLTAATPPPPSRPDTARRVRLGTLAPDEHVHRPW